MGGLRTETNCKVHTPVLRQPQDKTYFGGWGHSWYQALQLCSFYRWCNQSAEKLHTSIQSTRYT